MEGYRSAVAQAIYRAAYNGSGVPSPGWCWNKASAVQKEFCMKQADAAIAAYEKTSVCNAPKGDAE